MKRFVHEIHRRSLWQVLGIYLAGSWVALQVVEQLTEAAGLPEWVRPFSLVLLILGFPIVMATAFIQEGMTTRRPASPVETPVEADDGPPSPTPEPGGGRRLFTWRNALVGGGVAFLLLGLLTAGYLFMRASGIGPAGTLVAKGVLEEGAKVVLADFESPDPELADVVTGALRIDLLQSHTIRIVERGELAGALQRMQRDEDAPITGEVGRELAVREGYGAVIEGEVGTAGSGYVLTASIVGGEGWTALAAFRSTARSEDDLIDAIESLSRDIRDKAGESLRTIQGAPPLKQVTTASMEALRTYTRAEAAESGGDRPAAMELYERAIQIDPDFAMAHRKLAVVLSNMGIRRTDEVAALRSAYELRDRLPEAERYLAEAYYHSGVTGDRDAMIRAYESLLEIDPRNEAGLNNLGLAYEARGRLDEAEALFERAIEVEDFEVAYDNLARVRFHLGKEGEASAVYDRADSRLPSAAFVFEDRRVRLAAAQGAYERADSLAAAYAERFRRPDEIAQAANQRFRLDATRGRLRAAGEHLDDLKLASGQASNPLSIASDRAVLALVRGDSAAAARILVEAHDRYRDSLPAGERLYEFWLPVLFDAGAGAEAARIYDEWVREIPDDELGDYTRDGRRGLAARVAASRGDLESADRLWRAFERECPGVFCALEASLGLARVREAQGDPRGAIAEYERFLAERWIDRWAWDSQERGPVLERLGTLYDRQGDLDDAVKYYAMFVELWAGADEELQPRVEAAQARLEEIVRERG